MSAIKPQILAAISGALAAYLAEEEAARHPDQGRGGGAAAQPLGPGGPQPGHAT